MKKLLSAIALGTATLVPVAVFAQTAPAAPAAAPAKAYTTNDTEIGTLLANPATKAIVDKHFPGFSSADSIDMASGMTLRQLQQFKADLFTDEKLKAVDADLAKVPVK